MCVHQVALFHEYTVINLRIHVRHRTDQSETALLYGSGLY